MAFLSPPRYLKPNTVGRFGTRPGFTTTELLIACVILILLLAVLLPVLGSFQRQSRLITCGQNLRQIGVLMHNYLAEHPSYPGGATQTYKPNGENGPLRFWAQDLAEHARLKDLRAFICPTVKKEDIRPELAANKGGYAYVSYALNRYGIAPGNTDKSLPAKALAIPDPAKTLLAFDYDAVAQPYDGWYYATYDQLEREWDTISRRHTGKINALFCDGHVEVAPYKALFSAPKNQLPWVEAQYTTRK